MKKLMSMVLAVVLLLSCAALAYDGHAPVSEEKATISILTTNSGSKYYDWDNMTWWQKVISDANIDLKMEMLDYSVYDDSVKPRLAAGEDLPDIVRLPGSDSDMKYATSGLFLPLNEYIEEYGINLKAFFEKYPTLKASMTCTDGNIYYIPTLTPADANMRCLMVNRYYLEALGLTIDDITDIDSFTEYLYAVKENDCNGNGDPDDEIPLFMRSGMVGLWRMYFGIDAEGYYMSEDGTIICTATDERYHEFLIWANQLYADGLLYNEYTKANYDVQTAVLNENKAGSILHFVSNCTDYSMDIDASWQFNVNEPVMLPIAIAGPGTDGNPVCWGRNVCTGGGWGITKYCQDPETAFKLLDYVFSEEVGILTWYGIEGVDYTVADGVYSFTDKYYNNEDDYLTKMGYNCMALPNAYQLYGSKQCNEVRAAIGVMSAYVVNPSMGYTYYEPDENKVINAYATDLKTYFDEQQTAFISGTRSLDEWDAYVATVGEMGVDEILAVYQSAEDRNAK